MPGVGAGFKSGDSGGVGFGRAVFQVLSQEWRQNFSTKVQSGVAAEFHSAERTAVADFSAVMPWAHDQKNHVVGGVFRLQGFVDCGRAVNVFLVPKAVYDHGGDSKRLRGNNFVHGLLLPEAVVGWMP